MIIKIATFFSVAASAVIAAESTKCSLNIGERDDKDVRHRRMVSVNLDESCERSNVVSIAIPHQGKTRSFNMKKNAPRVDGSTTGGSNNKNNKNNKRRNGGKSYGYWYGEDDEDGSSFNYVQDEEGNISGSMVDLTNDTVMQFQIEDGESTVIITETSKFPDELHPPNEDGDEKKRKYQGSAADHMDDRLLSVTSSSSNETAVIDFSSSAFDTNQQISSTSNLRTNSRSLYDDNGANLDIIVVWTKDAECRNSGKAVGCTVSASTHRAMQNRVNLAVSETNTAYALSGVSTRLLLVHSYRHATYSERTYGFGGSLSRLRSGAISGVHDARKAYGADIVALLINDSQYCGLGYLGPRVDLMFSVTAWNCATGYFSFGHEVGHNLGLNHDRGTKNACNGVNYNYGYRDPSARFRSILAYACRSGQCDNNPANGRCTRVQRFSNPTYSYGGAPIGTATENNARKINDERFKVAKYYTHIHNNASFLVGKTVALQTVHNTYVRAQSGGTEGRNIDQQTYIGSWERFKIVAVPNKPGWYALRTIHGTYVRAHSGGAYRNVDQQTYIGSWEQFRILRVPGFPAKYVFRSIHGTYLRADSGGTEGRNINQQSYIASWEKFSIVYV